VRRRALRPLAIFNALFVGFLLAPIAVVVLVAFTPAGWLQIPTTRFSLRWFQALLSYPEVLEAFRNSLVIATLTSRRS
jgi:putative spermidine/putrescine transport system permease protein